MTCTSRHMPFYVSRKLQRHIWLGFLKMPTSAPYMQTGSQLCLKIFSLPSAYMAGLKSFSLKSVLVLLLVVGCVGFCWYKGREFSVGFLFGVALDIVGFICKQLIRMLFCPAKMSWSNVLIFHFSTWPSLASVMIFVFPLWICLLINLFTYYVIIIHLITQPSWAVENCVLHLLICLTV